MQSEIITAVVTAVTGASSTFLVAKMEVEKLRKKIDEMESKINFLENNVLKQLADIKNYILKNEKQ